MEKEKIVFFDGICNLCNSSVQFLLKYNHKKNLKFAALQSIYFRTHFPNEVSNMESILYFSDGMLYRESTAIIKITKELVFPLSLASVMLILPARFRDFFYRMVAKHRYRFFGKREVCYFPSPDLEERFLHG